MKSRVQVMFEQGDLTAPKGSPSWCLAVRDEARHALDSTKSTREQTRDWVNALREDSRFRRLVDAEGNPFLTWDAFCETPPPYGFGMKAADVDELIESKPLAQRLAADPGVKPLADGPGRPEQGNCVNNTIEQSHGSTNAAYLVRRLKRDAPDVAAALARGEYPSARAAGIAAGIVHVPSSFEIAQKAYLKLNATDRKRLRSWQDEQDNAGI